MPYPLTKRLFDIAFAGIGLLLLLPLGLLIALLIKLSDRGPVLFTQTRIGQFGKPFRIWKFRSMVLNADKLGLPLTGDGDRRITRIGRFLRKTKLDELPQLWNVLIGDMSFVGPRPEVPRYVDLYTPDQRQILQHKPGITDLASLLFRNEEDLLRGADDVEQFYVRYCLPKKIELNRQHAEHASLFQDIRIIWQTLTSLFTRRALTSVLPPQLSGLNPQPSPSDLRPLTSGPPPQLSGFKSHPSKASPPSRVAIIGTGELAARLVLDLGGSNDTGKKVVAFFDDDPRSWHAKLHDIPVIGMPECLRHRQWLDQIDEVIVALPAEHAARLQEIRALLKDLPLKITFAPTDSASPLPQFPPVQF